MVRPRTFFDFTIADVSAGRVVFELFNDVVPKTVENFRALSTGELGRSKHSDIPLYYKGSVVHRSVANFMIQGGDFTRGNGKGGESIYGEPFDDEDLSHALDSEGLLCMANKGPNTNGSQWFITLKDSPHLNGKHVVFGKVVSGFDIVKKIAEIPTDEKSRPLQPIVISHSGELELRKVPPKAAAPRGRSTSVSSTERKKKRRHSSDSRGSESESEDRRRKQKHRSKKEKEKQRSSKDKDRTKKKSRRSRSPADDRDRETGGRAASPHEETLEELDARLEREEKERLAAAKQKQLEDMKKRAAEGETSGGVRFKGRGRMKFRDPELDRRDRGDEQRLRY
ncbi:hypothetical protein M407DRAFT_235352 [Tulasnella calospora MUT 4182]|uniref:peptidylprolyl isomerase n=1 Tax=Tulasnella calospora MUT 4182 TaxID=1051891 RepID=A0A0C3QHY8_9AGAM|nr:hypothetical protein M407DRAFT_235352 [Tulasnella calospora MUT 4182]